MRLILCITLSFVLLSCHEKAKEEKSFVFAEKEPSKSELKEELTEKGFEIFDYVDEKTKDTVLMQQYFIAFL